MQCAQFHNSGHQPSAHLTVGPVSASFWFPDTGANQHVTPDLATLTDSAPYLGNDYLHVGDGKGLSISHIGHTTLHSPKRTFTLSNVLHVPHITKPLLSVQKFYRENNVYFEFHRLIQLLSSEFKLRDLGDVHYFLGIEVQPTAMGLMLRQQKYILDILTRAGMTSCKPVDTPISTSKVTILLDPLFFDPTRFRQIMSALQYLTFMRPDICFAVNRVCQILHAPTDSHWGAVKHILRYLRGTTTYGLHITRSSSFALHGFTNADWAGSTDDRKSTGSYLIFFGQTPISWKSSKQRIVARSSTEAEYKALADGTAEVIWLQYLLRDLQILSTSAPTLWCDNLDTTYLFANHIFHARTKHVEVDYHFVRDRVANKEIQIRFIPSHDQLADVFTKPLPTAPFTAFWFKLQVDSPPSA